MFNLFVDLISFHLQSVQILEQSKQVVSDLNYQLVDSIHINRQFNFISNHNLQEPLRKIRIFSGMLITAAESGDLGKVKDYAVKLDNCAQSFSSIVNELSEFLEVYSETNFEPTDLFFNPIAHSDCCQLNFLGFTSLFPSYAAIRRFVLKPLLL